MDCGSRPSTGDGLETFLQGFRGHVDMGWSSAACRCFSFLAALIISVVMPPLMAGKVTPTQDTPQNVLTQQMEGFLLPMRLEMTKTCFCKLLKVARRGFLADF